MTEYTADRRIYDDQVESLLNAIKNGMPVRDALYQMAGYAHTRAKTPSTRCENGHYSERSIRGYGRCPECSAVICYV